MEAATIATPVLPFVGVGAQLPRRKGQHLKWSRRWNGVRFGGVNAALPDALWNDYDPQTVRRHEKPEHRRMVSLIEQGYSIQEVADAMGVCKTTVTNIARQPWARKHMIETAKNEVSDEIRKFLEGEVLGSLEVIRDIRDSATTKDGDRLRAAEMLVDRQLGKATQPFVTENRGKSVRDMTNDELDAAIQRLGVTAPSGTVTS